MPCGSNVYINPNMEIITPLRNVLDLDNYMSGDCTFNYHISSLSKKCANLTGWILTTFYTRDIITMLTLFKSIVLPRLDYGSQLWSPFLIKHITQLEKIQQRSFTWLQTTQPTSGGAVTADSTCCANCVEPPRPQPWGARFTVFGHAGHADPLDG